MTIPVRWRIFALLFGFGFLAYVQSKSITVAAADMMPALHLSQFQISWIEEGYVLGYALLQFPGGVFGQRHGARRTFVIFGVGAFIAVLATPLAPYLLAGTGLFVALLLLQLLLGCSQAGLYPLSSGVFEVWFPPRWWAIVQGLQTAGLSLGAALTPPVISRLMHDVGWQTALVWASMPAIPLILVWAWYGRNTPREHPSVTPRELADIGRHAGSSVDSDIDWKRVGGVLRNRNVMFLSISYLCMNYSFYLLSNWVFLYLVQERHFSTLESGWLATAPPLAAALGAGVGGLMTSLAAQRLGNRWGYRLVPLIALPVGGALLLAAVLASNPYLALAALASCFCVIELCEGAYWGGAMTVGRGDTMAVGGVLNTGGNLGGLLGIPIVGYLSGLHLWRAAFLIGVGFALAAALAWLWIDVDHPAGESSEDRTGTAPEAHQGVES